jgi:hypothetical protein
VIEITSKQNTPVMKKATFFLAFMLLAVYSYSQHNYKFNYQAVVRNGAGVLVPNGSSVSLRLSILENAATGTVLYAETQTKTVNNNQGLVNLVIGDGTPVTGSIVFDANFRDLTKTKFLKVEVDPSGGTSYTDMGATQLQFVPYAAHAFTASFADNGTQWNNGGASSINYTTGNVNIGTSAPTGTSSLNVEENISTDHVLSVMQTGTTGGALKAAIYGKNNATNPNGIGVIGEHAGSGWGVYGKATGGTGIYASGLRGMYTSAVTGGDGIALEMDGYLKVSGARKTAYQIPPSTVSFTNKNLTHANQQSTDIIIITPISNTTNFTLPAHQIYWNGTVWQIWNVSDDGTPSSFPAGVGFNVLVIKQ